MILNAQKETKKRQEEVEAKRKEVLLRQKLIFYVKNLVLMVGIGLVLNFAIKMAYGHTETSA